MGEREEEVRRKTKVPGTRRTGAEAKRGARGAEVQLFVPVR